MKTGDKTIHWVYYVGWFFSGIVSFVISFYFAWILLSLITKVVGDFILVGGESHVTEDYMLGYAFIPSFGITIGVIQYFLLRQRLAQMGWWILTTTLGWSLAWLGISLRYNPLGTVIIPDSIWYSLSAGAILGIFIGLAQWLMLRVHVPHAVWWIPTNMLGFGIAGLLLGDISSLFEALVAITIPSFVTGIVLWMLLDKSPRDTNNENAPSSHRPKADMGDFAG